VRPARSSDLDTIVAPATPLLRSAIAVVRLSGSGALEIARKIAPALPSSPAPRNAHLCELLDSSGEAFDQALVTYFPGPASFTGEDVVEISLHGNPVLVRRLLETAREHGARAAQPGEFSRRAFLKGKLSLTEAESVAELIEARTEAQARGALERLAGRTAKALEAVRESLLLAHALWTASIDFPEQAGREDAHAIAEHLEAGRRALQDLAGRAAAGTRMARGIRVVLAGPPNAGKSTIFNRLVGSERAIVSPHPGTTRDTIEADVEIAGLAVRLVDTAGIRAGHDAVEAEGVSRARRAAAEADLTVYVHDASAPWGEEEKTAWEALSGARRLLVFNKTDVAPVPDGCGAVGLCALAPDAGPRVAAAIEQSLAGDYPAEAAGEIVSLRQHDLLERALAAAARAGSELARGERAEIAIIAVEEALSAIAEIAGDSTTEEVLDRVFSAFCIGK
jgi:tRNA modification GTPase